MDAIEFFVLHHERLHRQVKRDFLQGLSEAQMRLRPQGLNSIAWLVWHMARCEDALNLLLVAVQQEHDGDQRRSGHDEGAHGRASGGAGSGRGEPQGSAERVPRRGWHAHR
jgi:hypothetical protein